MTVTASTRAHVPLTGEGLADDVLGPEAVRRVLGEGLAGWNLQGLRVLCVIPDGTRTVPMPLLYRGIREELEDHVAALDWVIALGTHQPMSAAAIQRHLGVKPGTAPSKKGRVVNHEWGDPRTFVTLGEISADEVFELSGGLLRRAVPVRMNRMVLDYDVAIVVGPVFPHEVIGFSGGNKYFFPGLSGPEMIDVSHWLGALITASEILGAPGTTPVRQLIDRAAALVPVERRCIALVVRPEDARLHGVFLGSCEEAWAAAAALSADVHISYLDQPVAKVLAIVPPMYADLWTAAKGIYKLEPIVADGGELVLLAPHVHTFSHTHDEAIRTIGYHCRDYFLGQPERFHDLPLGVLAHSTHVRGRGTYETRTGHEQCRISVTLATAIPRGACESVALDWRDPGSIDPSSAARNGTLVVPRAGEALFRLRAPA